jgi:SAM-dependent methyltransferase
MAALVNWSELWKFKLFSNNRTRLGNAKYWDKHAVDFNDNMVQMQELTTNQLERIQLLPEYTVLDVGAGTGRLAIPIAKQVKQVTAVEPSKIMFALLKSNVAKANARNILPVNIACEDLNTHSSVSPHDVVLASFCLFMVDLANALQQLNALAKKRVYLFASASEWISDELQKIIYNGSLPFNSSDYIYVYNILHDLGILANVEVWNFKSDKRFSDLDEAASNFKENYRVPPKNEGELREYLKDILVEENGKLWLKRERKAAMIWWTKT